MASLTEAIGVKEAKWVTIIGCALLSSIGGTYIWLHTYMKYPSYRKEDTKTFFKSIGEIKSALTNPDVTRLNEIKLLSSKSNNSAQDQTKPDNSTQDKSQFKGSTQNSNNPDDSIQNQSKTEVLTSDSAQNKPEASEKSEDINSYSALTLELFERVNILNGFIFTFNEICGSNTVNLAIKDKLKKTISNIYGTSSTNSADKELRLEKEINDILGTSTVNSVVKDQLKITIKEGIEKLEKDATGFSKNDGFFWVFGYWRWLEILFWGEFGVIVGILAWVSTQLAARKYTKLVFHYEKYWYLTEIFIGPIVVVSAFFLLKQFIGILITGVTEEEVRGSIYLTLGVSFTLGYFIRRTLGIFDFIKNKLPLPKEGNNK
ncbi:MAG: hypothetical protein NUV74_06705 [Candidatus Brocadiaceae bacterium]|nr:hypothetical protein [Candidatus Brocadiaceae bacterium]